MPQTMSTPSMKTANNALAGKKTSGSAKASPKKVPIPSLSRTSGGSTQETLRGFGGTLADAWMSMFGDPRVSAGLATAAMNPTGSGLVPEVAMRAADQAHIESSRRNNGMDVGGMKAPVALAAPAVVDTDTAGTKQGTSKPADEGTFEPIIDPLALQAFFVNVLGPYMSQMAGRQQNFIDTYQNQMGTVLNGNLPGQYRDVLRSQVPQQIAGYQNAFNAMNTAAMAGPAYGAMMKQISDYANASNKLYFNQQQGAQDNGLLQMLQILGGGQQ